MWACAKVPGLCFASCIHLGFGVWGLGFRVRVSGLYWGYIGVILGFYWGYVRVILGYIGVISGLYYVYVNVHVSVLYMQLCIHRSNYYVRVNTLYLYFYI